MEKLNVKLKDICRICLLESKDAVDLFADKHESKSILDIIHVCFHIQLRFQSNLPTKICSPCLNELNIANTFRMKCETIDERFDIFSEKSRVDINSMKEVTPDDDLILETFVDSVQLELNDGLNTQKSCNASDNFSCNSCGKILKTKTSLLRHLVSMHQKRKHIGKVTGFGVNRKYHCTRCTYSTPHSQTLVNHMRRHNGERPYLCHCGKSFTQSSGLAAHLKTHSETKFFTCSTCGKQFKHAYTLKRHFAVHESGKFVCNVCHKGLKTKQSLQEHTQRHYNVRNYSCEDCGNTFVTSSELIHHKRKHDLNKKLECHLCGYKTHEKKSLILHLKRHAGDKTHKCKLCEVTFYTQGEACRHQRVHTREKPFSCPACSQRFSYSPSLNKHMSTVHDVQYKWGDLKSLKKRK